MAVSALLAWSLRDKIIFKGAYVESYAFYTKQACLYTFEYN